MTGAGGGVQVAGLQRLSQAMQQVEQQHGRHESKGTTLEVIGQASSALTWIVNVCPFALM